ncbi:hypothetical protein Scep_017177 [Stephania cephalantha]|uniref:Uncharacterized protein n=1 Tax=Stephania cephalantha TaxID=152367 RepID=A0AAP0INZ1_9MAGN
MTTLMPTIDASILSSNTLESQGVPRFALNRAWFQVIETKILIRTPIELM